MTTPDSKTVAELFLPLKPRMEAAGCWPRRYAGSHTLRFHSTPNTKGGPAYNDWFWFAMASGTITKECHPDDAANALLASGLEWLSMHGYMVGHGSAILFSLNGAHWMIVKRFDGETTWHALAVALDATLPDIAKDEGGGA